MVRGQTWYVCDTTPSRDGAFCGCCHDTFCARFPPLNGLYTSRPSSSFRPSIDYYYRAAIPTALFQFLPYPRRRRYARLFFLPFVCALIEIPFLLFPTDIPLLRPMPSTVSLSDDIRSRCWYFYLHLPRNGFISTCRYSFQFSSLLSRTANLTVYVSKKYKLM